MLPMVLAFTMHPPNLASNQSSQLLPAPIKRFTSPGQLTARLMVLKSLWLQEPPPGRLLGTRYAERVVKMYQPVCVSAVRVG